MATEVYAQMFVVFVLIGFGFLAKIFKLMTPENTRSLIKFLFSIPLPILVFHTFATTEIDSSLFNYSIISGSVVLSSILLAFLISKLFKFDSKTTGTIIVTSGFASTLLFALPFISSFYKIEELKVLFLYDFTHALIAYSLIYYLAGRFGNKRSEPIVHSLASIIKTPMIIALVTGLLWSIFHFPLPSIVGDLSDKIGSFFGPIILICIGNLLNLKFIMKPQNLFKAMIAVSVKMLFGFLVAMVLIDILEIEDSAEKIVLICASTPSAGLSVVFASENGLDTDLTSAIIAISMLIGLITTPLIILG